MLNRLDHLLFFLFLSFVPQILSSQCNVDGGTLTGGPFEFCASDGNSDFIMPDAIHLTGEIGPISQWVITDEQGIILGLPPSPDIPDFDGAGVGQCLVWNLSYESGLVGLSVGQSANNLQGCYSLSNPISVFRLNCCGDAVCSTPDIEQFNYSTNAEHDINNANVTIGNAQLTIERDFYGSAQADENEINASQTDGVVGIRLGVKNSHGPNDNMVAKYSFSEEVCDLSFEIWDIDQTDEILVETFRNGIPVASTFSLGSCVRESQSWLKPDGQACQVQVNGNVNHSAVVTVYNCIDAIKITSFDQGAGNGGSYTIVFNEGCSNLETNGGTLTGGPFEFCVDDGEADNIMVSAISLSGNAGSNSAWVVTDDQGTILGLPPMPSAVDFDGAGVGTCLVWHLSFEDGLMGAEVGMNANDLQGCYSLSNPISVIRNVCCTTDNCSTPDLSSLDGSTNAEHDLNNANLTFGSAVLSLERHFNGTGREDENKINNSQTSGAIGIRLGVKHASDVNNNMQAFYRMSEPVCDLKFEIWDIDQTDQMIVETFNNGNPVSYTANVGSCVVQSNHIFTTDGAACEVQVNGNANHMVTISLSACVDEIRIMSYDRKFGNGGSYTVVFNEGCTQTAVNGGTLSGGPFEFCVSDGVADNIPAGSIALSGNSGSNSQWVVTDDQGNILGLPPMPSVVDFDGAGLGTCLVWHLSFEDGLVGAEVGMNANNLQGCYSLSNPISVIRSTPEGGILTGGPFEFCVGDGVADNISAGSIELSGNSGSNSQWVVTDDQGNILGLPPMPSVVDFDGAGIGTCLVWHLSFEDELIGAEVGMNANDLQGCYSLSNPISVVRTDCSCDAEGGTLIGGPFEFCVGDGIADNIPAGSITLSDNTGSNSQWVVTDDQGNILGLPPMPSFVDFDEAGVGTCLVWHLSYEDGLVGASVGMNASDLQGCYSLSNPISVIRSNPNGGDLFALDNNTLNRTVIANRASGTISVINSDTDQVEQTISLPNNGEPMYVVYNDLSNTILVGDYNGRVVGYDGLSLNFAGSANAGAGVFHMWLSPDNQQLWVNNELDKTISVINPNTYATITTFSIPADLLALGYKPHDVIVMPNNAAAFVSMLGPLNEDYVVKYSATSFEELDRVAVGLDPHLSLTAANPYLYVASQGADELKVFNRSDLSEVATLSIPNAHGLGMSPDGSYLYVGNISDGGTNATYTVDLSTNTLVGSPVDAPFGPHNYAVTSDIQKLYVTHSGAMSDQVSVYNIGPSPSLLTTITVENNPFGLIAYTYQEKVNEIEICAGDGESDAFDVSLTNDSGSNSAWVITDVDGVILALPPGPPFDLEGAGPGTCLVWHLSFEDGITGAQVGLNANDLQGCFSLSNPIIVNRNQPDGGTLTGGPFEFCVGDGVVDNIPAGSITLSGNSGSNSQWVVTDEQGNILGLPPMPSVVDFDGAGTGTCLIWHLSFEDGLVGAEMGMNANDLQGCYSLSNPIAVNRNDAGSVCDPNCDVAGGALTGGPFEFCVGDGSADNIPAGSITLTGNSGSNSQWVVTDDQGNILGLPPMPSVVDFDGAGSGTCLIWHLSFEDGLVGAEMGMNANDLQGCYSLSNPISVIRTQPEGGTLVGGPFEFCVGDGIPDNIPTGAITLSGESGSNSQWVVTDDQGNILGLPPMPSVVNFDGAGTGTCLIWHLSFEDGLLGAEMGMNANDLQGCYSLSNPIAVVRNNSGAVCTSPCTVDGGTLTGGPFTFDTVGDGVPDMIPAGSITLANAQGMNSQWIVTDAQGIILGLPPMPGVVDFDSAGAGTCLVWHLSYDGNITGLAMGLNANDITGCWSLSNPIEVIRSVAGNCQVNGGELIGGPFEFCVGDGVADNIPAGAITLAGNSGMNSQWVVTDDQGTILGLPPMPSVVDFDGAGTGTCLIWHLSFEDGLIGAEMGMNANDLQGCYSLSNPISVIRSQPVGGALSGGPFEFCVGDGIADNIPSGAITLTGNSGTNSQWVVTDDQGTILGLPPMPSVVDFDGAGTGTCLIWHLSFEDGLMGAEVGMNANDLMGCYNLSNPIEVTREDCGCTAQGGTLTGGPFQFCVGDGAADNIPPGSIMLTGDNGMNSQWVVTDDQGTILGLPPMPSAVDFDGAGLGTCLVWHLSFDDGLVGAEMGMNANDLQGCYSLSNPIEVNREDCSNNSPGVIVINEVIPDGNQVELINTGGMPVDISSYWLCDFPQYVQLSNTNIVCGGDLILNPGEVITVSSNVVTINNNDGEIGLYTTNSFSNPDAIIDYVEWGFSGHGRSDEAVAAGIWTTGDFVPSFTLGNALVYDGDGDASDDWQDGISSPCMSNCMFARDEHANPVLPGLYEAFSIIRSEGVISAGDVDFTANTCIELQPNFEVRIGNNFQAYIEGCNNLGIDNLNEDTDSK